MTKRKLESDKGNVEYSVYATNDYSLFKILDGNRSVKDGRVKKIVASIQKVGWIRNPIIVNENFEIVDGQGRFSALKSLGLPIEYIVDEGIGIDECREMNIHQTNWNTMDYIESYAARGNKNYVNFKHLMNDFKGVGLQAIIYSAIGLGNQNVIRNGELICNDADMKIAEDRLNYLKSLKPHIKVVDGRIELLEMAIVFIYGFCESADVDRLTYVIEKYSYNIPPIATLEGALREIENLYNNRYRGKLANFVNEYKEYAKEVYSAKHEDYRSRIRMDRPRERGRRRRVSEGV